MSRIPIALVLTAIAGCHAPAATTMDAGAARGDATEDVALDEGGGAPDGASTYWGDLRPWLDEHCMGCHDGRGIAPYDMGDPSVVQGVAELMVDAVESRAMPPWHAASDCRPLKDDPSLNDSEMAVLRTWVEDGRWVGEPANYRPDDPSQNGPVVVANDADALEIRPSAAHDVAPDSPDSFRCFPITPEFAAPRYVRGFEPQPDNLPSLHHLIVFTVKADPAVRDELARLDALDPEPGYDCFGAPNLPGVGIAGVWAPGMGTTLYPEGTGVPVEPGDQFVLQMHYNTLQSQGGPDRSGARLLLLPEGEEPGAVGRLAYTGNLAFSIPGGVDGTSVPDEECDVVYALAEGAAPPSRGVDSVTARRDPTRVGQSGCVTNEIYLDPDVTYDIWAAFPHMHYRGVSIELEAVPARYEADLTVPDDADAQCLARVPRWDFDWQRKYWFEEPARLGPGGMLRLRCRFDNSDSTADLRLGSSSTDEMCFGLFYLTEARR